jgi:adenosyl cobinamide kinase/adenosyl cobinamide phosphate guanylyltransferase
VITLVLGGVRSGKSEVATELVSAWPAPVTVVATAVCPPGDTDFARRIERHRTARPPDWTTIEEPHDLAGVLAKTAGTVLVDALGTWVANAPGFEADVAGLCDALGTRAGDTVLVSDEVGLSIHPPTEAGRQFVDALGECNRAVATVADRVLLVVAGRVLELGAR